ncbi:MAG: LPP20 family lipoprotein [Gammaproteobacteria bacterium]|nr:LPP20 family lipoprotein [Gammaproteobacteria bacterium]
MKKVNVLIAGLVATSVLGGCSNSPEVKNESPAVPMIPLQAVMPVAPVAAPAAPVPAPVVKKPVERVKISAIGYGAESTFSAYTPGQRRLMAIRASKLDAYRALAEQLYGIKIDSNTAISTLTAKNDSFRARVNAVVRGARVVSVTPMADNNYETVLEVYVDKNFFDQTFVYSGDTVVAKEPSESCGTCLEVSSY